MSNFRCFPTAINVVPRTNSNTVRSVDGGRYVAAEGGGSNQTYDESRHAATSRWALSMGGILCGCGMGASFARWVQPAECNMPDQGVERMKRVGQHRVSLDTTQARKRIRAKNNHVN